jgi:hypothetical protein
MNFEQAGDFGGGLAPGRYGFDDLFLLLGGDFRLSSGDTSSSARLVQAGARALADHLSHEFGEGAEHLQRPAGPDVSIDSVSDLNFAPGALTL